MYGAVLWADRCTNRALIWCEDHGELAFFEGEPASFTDTSTFEEGDLVAFKIRNGRGMRLAYEMKVVASEEYPGLARNLRCASPEGYTGIACEPSAPDSNILPFQPRRAAGDIHDATSPQTAQSSGVVKQIR